MILIVDNYDSFVHNLGRHFQRLGRDVVVKRNDTLSVPQIRALNPLAIVLSPGPCAPLQAGRSLEIVRELHQDFPMLGVCLGHQTIAEALGAKVVRAKSPVHGRTSLVVHTSGGLFTGLPIPMTVCRYHSLVVDYSSLPSGLSANALADGDVVMAIEHESLPVFGVQFHPEAILTEHGYELLANFLRLAGVQVTADPGRCAREELRDVSKQLRPLPVGPITF